MPARRFLCDFQPQQINKILGDKKNAERENEALTGAVRQHLPPLQTNTSRGNHDRFVSPACDAFCGLALDVMRTCEKRIL